MQLSERIREPLLKAQDKAGFFEVPYGEITILLKSDTYRRFVDEVSELQPQVRSNVGAISRPEKAAAVPQHRPEQATLDNWNEKALKALNQSTATDFYQVGDVVLVANRAAGNPSGANWVQQQAGVIVGTITMTKKGGAFDPGSIKAVGVGDEAKFKTAIARVSKKTVEIA